MNYTSSEAGKLLKKLMEEQNVLLERERQSREFVASVGEDLESVRPLCDYSETQEKLNDLERKIRQVKHSINLFNLHHEVPGFSMTVDQMLVYIPQLTTKKQKLFEMAGRLPKVRDNSFGHSSNFIDYRYANYDVEKAKEDFAAVSDELSRAQTALDLLNTTETLEIDF